MNKKLTPAQECAFTARSRMDISGRSKNDKRWYKKT
jgi:hypothetical protein